MTRPAAASSTAARRPATPAPITMKSVSAGACFIYEKCYHACRRPVREGIQLSWTLMISVPVEVKPRPYKVLVESGLLTRAGHILRETLSDRGKIFVITVAPVHRRWGKA